MKGSIKVFVSRIHSEFRAKANSAPSTMTKWKFSVGRFRWKLVRLVSFPPTKWSVNFLIGVNLAEKSRYSDIVTCQISCFPRPPYFLKYLSSFTHFIVFLPNLNSSQFYQTKWFQKFRDSLLVLFFFFETQNPHWKWDGKKCWLYKIRWCETSFHSSNICEGFELQSTPPLFFKSLSSTRSFSRHFTILRLSTWQIYFSVLKSVSFFSKLS